MPNFYYKATDASGLILTGVRFATSDAELAGQLHQAGLHLLEYRQARFRILRSFWDLLVLGTVSRRDLIDFSNNMGVMLRAGVPLVQSLSELYEDMDNRYFKKVIKTLIDNITAGDSLNEAMARERKTFPEIYVNVIAIGEETGLLDNVFFDLARHYKRIDDLILQTRKAFIYPAFVIFALFLAAYVYLSMVFPLLFSLLDQFDVELPLITVIMQRISSFMQVWWPFILTGFILFLVLFILSRKLKMVRYWFDWCELNLPGIKKVFIQLRMAFFMRYMSMLLGAGITTLRGMELAIKSVNNLVLRKIMSGCHSEITAGAMLSDSFRKRKIIPRMVTRMIAVGEEAGNISRQMEYVADQYEEDLSRRISWALTIMEPVLIFILAGLALALIMGILLPIYDLVSELSSQVNTGF
ncbi:MAG: type II secretion system F family protein [Desulfobulbales bacterium]|nr:type II secretion system F family protein [Desulfobulbales bacterium]